MVWSPLVASATFKMNNQTINSPKAITLMSVEMCHGIQNMIFMRRKREFQQDRWGEMDVPGFHPIQHFETTWWLGDMVPNRRNKSITNFIPRHSQTSTGVNARVVKEKQADDDKDTMTQLYQETRRWHRIQWKSWSPTRKDLKIQKQETTKNWMNTKKLFLMSKHLTEKWTRRHLIHSCQLRLKRGGGVSGSEPAIRSRMID